MEDWDGKKYFAEFDNFRVDSEDKMYKLSSVGHYHGTAGQYVS